MWIINILIFNLIIVFITELLVGFCIGIKSARETVTVSLINIITNPLAVLCGLCMTLFLDAWQHLGIIILEIIVVLVEGFMFSRFNIFKGKNPYLCSFILNLASFLTGEIIDIFL